jgi:AmmeMemoRadiSam system protein A
MSMLGDRVADVTTSPGPDPSAGLPAPVSLDPETTTALLRIAREAVTAAATHGSPARHPSHAAAGALDEPGAAFVTIMEGGSLRGCMGSLVAEQPLGDAVASAALSAAVRDPRFLPLAEHELSTIHIDVSVLGPAVALRDPAAFRPGIDGIIVARDGRRALLLPEVATDQGWDAREMLDAVCEKAGLEGHAWHDQRTRLFVFRTIRVSEGEVPAGS